MNDNTQDVVTGRWLEQHGITIPRRPGICQSPTAWVRVDNFGVIIAAGEKDQTVLAFLVEQKILGDADIDYGIAYVTCRSAERAYRKQKGYKSSLDLTFLSGGGALSCTEAAEVFGLMCHEIGTKNRRIVEYACDTYRSPTSQTNFKPSYRAAFNALRIAFDRAVKQVKAASEKSLAPSTSSC